MLRMPQFEVVKPTTVDEAVRALHEAGENAMLVAGGTEGLSDPASGSPALGWVRLARFVFAAVKQPAFSFLARFGPFVFQYTAVGRAGGYVLLASEPFFGKKKQLEAREAVARRGCP